MKPKISRLIWLALVLAILPVIILADNLPNQIVWNKDGAEMAYIPAGSFEMGDAMNETESWMAPARPVHTVTLDGFYMDKTEVTVGQFKAFLADSEYSWDGSWDSVAAYSPTDDHPMIYVTWHDAVAYAEWAGKRLPTEAEWEKAARGGLQGKRYPWGDEITHDDANYSGTGGTDTWTYNAPVGSFGANGYGLYDVAGNVWEWCADWYDEDYYTSSPATNPPGPDTGSYRVLRGGNWNYAASNLRVAYRSYYYPDNRAYFYGFRCVSGLNFTSGSFTTLLPSDGETGFNWFAGLSLDSSDYTWSIVDSSSATLTVRLFVQPLGGIDASAWDFSAVSTVDALANQLGSAGLNLTEGADYQLMVVGQDDNGTTDIASDDLTETIPIQLSDFSSPDDGFPLATINLTRGTNMIGLPLQPATPFTARSLIEHIHSSKYPDDGDGNVVPGEFVLDESGNTTATPITDVNWIIRYDVIGQNFEAYVWDVDNMQADVDDLDGDGDVAEMIPGPGFAIEGGVGYLVNVSSARAIPFLGSSWEGLLNPLTPPSPAPSLELETADVWAFILLAQLPLQLRGQAETYGVKVTNLATGRLLVEIDGLQAEFRLPMVDTMRQSIVHQGDQIRVEVCNPAGLRVADSEFVIRPQDLARAYRMVDLQYNPIPDLTSLLQNYPNPFNPETWIPFELSQDAEVVVSIYDVSGQQVRTFPIGFKPAGIYSSAERAIHWDGRNTNGESVSSGVYFYRLQAGDYSQTRKMVILK